MLEDYPDILTARDVQEILYVGKNKVYSLLASGELKAVKMGRDWRITKENVLR